MSLPAALLSPAWCSQDVQPANEAEWHTPPFELNSVNEYLYGRGTSDNKGPILAFVFAVKELLDLMEARGEAEDAGVPGGKRSLPVNVVFVFEGARAVAATVRFRGVCFPLWTDDGGCLPSLAERGSMCRAGGCGGGGCVFCAGEEENGSIGFREAVQQNLRWFEGVQLIVISNTNWVGENVPCITYGMRGMMSVSVTVSGPQRDVHSGNDGGVFVEPMMDLIHVMGTVVQRGTSEIQVSGGARRRVWLAVCEVQSGARIAHGVLCAGGLVGRPDAPCLCCCWWRRALLLAVLRCADPWI